MIIHSLYINNIQNNIPAYNKCDHRLMISMRAQKEGIFYVCDCGSPVAIASFFKILKRLLF